MKNRCRISFLSIVTVVLFSTSTYASSNHNRSDTTDLGYGINAASNGLVMKYSHRTAKGKVYILPYDNMPCLMPDSTFFSRMPVRTAPGLRNSMPNLSPEYKRKRESY